MKTYFMQKIQRHISEHRAAYIIAVFFYVLGISCGVFYYKYIGDYFSDHFGHFMESYLTYLAEGKADRLGIFFTTFFACAKTVLFLLLSGIVPITLPVAYLIVGGRGFVFGFSAAMLFCVLKLNGFIIFLFGLLPQCILITPVYLFCVICCTVRVKDKFKRMYARKKGISPEDIQYLQMHLIALAAALPACIYVALVMPFIMNGIYQMFVNML